MTENEKKYWEARENGYEIHHDAMAQGYVSLEKDYMMEEYHGRFGDGYKMHRANANHPVQGNSRKYHWITYIIKKN